MANELKRFFLRAYFRLDQLQKESFAELPGYLRGRREQLKLWAARTSWRFSRRYDFTGRRAAAQTVEQILYLAAISYTPQPLSCPTIVFRGTHRPFACEDDPYLGWRHLLLGPAETCDIPGDHVGIFGGSNAEALADRIKTLLSNVAMMPSCDQQGL
jgi:hypothetical protein